MRLVLFILDNKCPMIKYNIISLNYWNYTIRVVGLKPLVLIQYHDIFNKESDKFSCLLYIKVISLIVYK